MASRKSKGAARPAAKAPARGKRTGRGMRVLPLVLLGFLVITTGVIMRRVYGTARSRDLKELESSRVQLEARRAQLESEVRDLSSRAALAPVVERRLQMHVPTDSQVVIVPRPKRERAPR